MSEPLFHLPVRVYWEDTDAGGVVYHASYLRFLERARSDWLRDAGFSQASLQREGVLFVVQQMSLRFRRSAQLDDGLDIYVNQVQMRRLSFVVQQSIHRQDTLLCEAQATIACVGSEPATPSPVSSAQWRPRALPSRIVKELFGAANAR